MKKIMNWLKKEESGQGMVEYGLIIAGIAIVVVGAIFLLGRRHRRYVQQRRRCTDQCICISCRIDRIPSPKQGPSPKLGALLTRTLGGLRYEMEK